MKVVLRAVSCVFFLAVVAACNTSTVPTVVIQFPVNGSVFTSGQVVSVQSVSTDAKGILSVQLIVDGQPVAVNTPPAGQSQNQFVATQTWNATTAGSHFIVVRATNTSGISADSSVVVTVNGGGVPTPIPPTTIPPTGVPPTGVPPTAPPPVSCTPSSIFITDVTVPDGTSFAPGTPFVKTWRVLNSGSCTWDNGYSIVFTGGEQLNGQSPSPIPRTAIGEQADVSVSMFAPSTPGTHAGIWQLQASNGQRFGTLLTVSINVQGIPTVVPGCSGNPIPGGFSANPATISPGGSSTLNWGFISNASAVVLVSPNGNQNVTTPGSLVVSPPNTATYTLIAVCGANSIQQQATINVNVTPSCSGRPVMSSFTANPSSISSGGSSNLNWGSVQNATYIALGGPNGNTGVSTPGNMQVNPTTTTSYTLTAYCGANSSQLSTTVFVNQGPVAPPISGTWRGYINGGVFIINLVPTIGCTQTYCTYSGTWNEQRNGQNIFGNISRGTFDGVNLSLSVVNAQPGNVNWTFNGQATNNNQNLVGNWTESRSGIPSLEQGTVAFQR